MRGTSSEGQPNHTPFLRAPPWNKLRLCNPWFEARHYTAALDWCLEVLDGIEEGAFDCRERTVGYASSYLLRRGPTNPTRAPPTSGTRVDQRTVAAVIASGTSASASCTRAT